MLKSFVNCERVIFVTRERKLQRVDAFGRRRKNCNKSERGEIRNLKCEKVILCNGLIPDKMMIIVNWKKIKQINCTKKRIHPKKNHKGNES